MHLFRYSSLLLFSAALAGAQTPPPPDDERSDEPLHLDNLVVTASPYSRSQAELAQPTTVVTGPNLALHQSNSLGELLSGEPGVSSTYFGPGASRPIIRGLGGDRIRMLTNGSGTMDASVISPDHAVALDPMLIERVEVIRGPATLLYGGSAVGGVVNVIDHRVHTTRPDEPFNARIDSRVSSGDDGKSVGAVLEGGAGALAWHLDGYRRTAGDVEIPGFAESARLRAEEAAEAGELGEELSAEISGHIPNTALSADGGAASVSFIGDPGYVGISYHGHNTLYGVPAGAHEHDEKEGEHEGETGEGPVRIDLKQRRVDVQGAITQPRGLVREVRFKIGSARYRHVELEGDEIGTVFRNRGFDGRLELLHDPIGGFTGAAGWQGGRSDFSAVGDEAFLPPSRTTHHAVFLLEEIKTGNFTWQLGGRGERHSIDRRDGSGVARDTTLASASAGLVWNLSPAWTVGISLSRAERAANAQELFANGPHIGTNAYEIGDPALDAEKSRALDVTLRKRLGFITGSLTAFVNRFNGYIYEQPTGQVAVGHDGGLEFLDPGDPEAERGGLAVYRFVQHDARFVGAEIETILRLLHREQQQLDLSLSADVVRAENTTLDADLPRITPPRSRIALAWTNDRWSLGSEVQFVGRQNRIAPGETRTDGYALVSAHAGYRWVTGRRVWDFYVRGANLTDREARMHTSLLKDVAPLPGRSVTFGMQASF